MVVKENRKDVRYLPDDSKTKTHEVQEASCLYCPLIKLKSPYFFVHTIMMASMPSLLHVFEQAMIYRVWLGKQTTLPRPLPIASLVQGGKTKPRQNTTATTIITSSPHGFRTGKEYITIDFPADEALHNKSVTIERVEDDSTFIVPGLPFANSADLAAAVRSPPGASVRCADASMH